MPKSVWKTYFEKTKGGKPRSLLLKALPFVHNKNEALDLGSGALRDSLYLLSAQFKHVTAIDKESVADEIVKYIPDDRFSYITSTFEDFNFPKGWFDLINAQYSLPFIDPGAFNMVFSRIIDSLKIGGVFAGQLFGDKDEWIENKNMTFHTRSEVESMISSLETLYLEEEEVDKPAVMVEMKHWHIFHFIVRKA